MFFEYKLNFLNVANLGGVVQLLRCCPPFGVLRFFLFYDCFHADVALLAAASAPAAAASDNLSGAEFVMVWGTY